MLAQINASSVVSQNVQIDAFMSNLDIFVSLQPPRYLFWAPIISQFALVQLPVLYLDAWCGFLAAFLSHVVCIFRSVPQLSSIAAQLSTDGRFMHPCHFGNLSLAVIHFLQGRKLISLFPGKLCGRSHESSFDLVVRKALILPWLTSFFDHQSCTC